MSTQKFEMAFTAELEVIRNGEVVADEAEEQK